MKVSDEVLIEMLRPFSSKRDRSIARELLAYRQAKPVATVIGKRDVPDSRTIDCALLAGTKLYAHPGEDAKEKP